MNLARLLRLPWYGASSERWSVGALIFLVVLLSASVVVATAYVSPLSVNWIRAATYALAFMNAAMWAMLLPNTLLLAYTARRLLMPGAQRDACLSLSLYALLGIVVPVALTGVIGGNMPVVAVELALGAGLGMAFAVLPSYCMPVLVFVVLLHGVVWRWLALPNDMQPGFLSVTVPLVITLWLGITWLWRRALSPQASLDGLHAPLSFLVRLGKWQRLLGLGNATTDTKLAAQIPGWLRTKVDLRSSGPGHTVQSLRVALGEMFMPQTRSSRVRKSVIGLLLCALGIGLPVLQVIGYADHGHGMPLTIGVRFMLMWGVPFVSAVLAVVTANALRQRWSRSNCELPLLALLPGLGDPAQIKRALLRASLPPALYGQAFLLVISLLVAGWWHLGMESGLLLLLGQLCGAALLLVLTLMAFAGGSLSGPNIAGLVVLAMIWFCLPIVSVLVSRVPVPWLGLMVAIGWVAAAGVLLWLGGRCWRELQQRPHPFLVN